ncbi:MAG TPA: glycosyltransferase [Pedobacter sp.]
MSLAVKVDYSIIICSYNPDEDLFIRCLNAVSRLSGSGLTMEVILVDNNSTVPLDGRAYIQDFLSKVPFTKLLLVREQGLSYARMAGIEEAAGADIIFFDDDNEPDTNYIEALTGLKTAYPNVAAWGPGCVDVDFISGIDEPLLGYARAAFQDRHEEAIVYSNQRSWQSCYPFGTGLCVKKAYLEEYISLVKQNKFTLTDRKGGQMSSGGDTQMVLFCISKGAAAGVAPELRLTHMVPAKRTTFDYLKKLAYGTGVCYSTCILEVFPEYLPDIEKKVVSERRFVNKTLKKYVSLFFKKKPDRTLDLITYIAAVSGDYMVLNKPVPALVKWVLKRLKVT